MDETVAAEDAPIGVQLWTTGHPRYADNYTLRSVATVRTETNTYVEWTYRSGAKRVFGLGEHVVIRRTLASELDNG